jgi:hypothetical protein
VLSLFSFCSGDGFSLAPDRVTKTSRASPPNTNSSSNNPQATVTTTAAAAHNNSAKVSTLHLFLSIAH